MYNFTYSMKADDNQVGRSAYEIQKAALEHEKRRIQLLDGDGTAARPHMPTGLLTVLLAILLG